MLNVLIKCVTSIKESEVDFMKNNRIDKKSTSKGKRIKSDSINFRCYESDKKRMKKEADKYNLTMADYIIKLFNDRQKCEITNEKKEDMRLLLRTLQDEFYDSPEFKKYYNERIDKLCQ